MSVFINGSSPTGFRHNGTAVSRLYFNGYCVWASNEVSCTADLTITLDASGHVVSAATVPIQVQGMVARISGEPEPTVRSTVPMTGEAGPVFSAYTDLYVKITSPFVADMPVSFLHDSRAVAPVSAAGAEDLTICIQTDVQAAAPGTVHGKASQEIVLGLDVQAVAPGAAPCGPEATDVSLGYAADLAVPGALPVVLEVPNLLAVGLAFSPVTAAALALMAQGGPVISGEAVLSVIAAASLETVGGMEIQGEAMLSDNSWIYPVQTDADLFIQQVLAAEQSGGVLRIS